MVIKSYHIILAVKILGCFLLKWAGFGELLGWKSSTRSGNTVCVCVCVCVCASVRGKLLTQRATVTQQSRAFYMLSSCVRAVLISSPDT